MTSSGVALINEWIVMLDAKREETDLFMAEIAAKPATDLDELKTRFIDFVWAGRRERLKRDGHPKGTPKIKVSRKFATMYCLRPDGSKEFIEVSEVLE